MANTCPRSDACTTCGRGKAEASLQICSACRDPAILYCSRECQKVDWRAGHRAVCLSARDYALVLMAIETAFFGSAFPDEATDAERLARIVRAFGTAAPDIAAAGTHVERIVRVLERSALPPIVEILRADGPRWVAFAPMRCFGVFDTEGAAAAALVSAVGAKARGVGFPPGILPLPPGRAATPPPSYLEAGASALVIGTHVRPVAWADAADAVTAPESLASLVPRSLPRDHVALAASGLWLALPARTPAGAETVEQVQVHDLPRWLRRKRAPHVWAEGVATGVGVRS